MNTTTRTPGTGHRPRGAVRWILNKFTAAELGIARRLENFFPPIGRLCARGIHKFKAFEMRVARSAGEALPASGSTSTLVRILFLVFKLVVTAALAYIAFWIAVILTFGFAIVFLAPFIPSNKKTVDTSEDEWDWLIDPSDPLWPGHYSDNR